MYHGNDMKDALFIVQEMTLFEPWQTTVQDRHQIFYWGEPEQIPEVCVGSTVDMRLHRFLYPCARFASERLRLQAMTSLQPNQMADIALACINVGVPSAMQYWWETLYLQFLQVSSQSRLHFTSYFLWRLLHSCMASLLVCCGAIIVLMAHTQEVIAMRRRGWMVSLQLLL